MIWTSRKIIIATEYKRHSNAPQKSSKSVVQQKLYIFTSCTTQYQLDIVAHFKYYNKFEAFGKAFGQLWIPSKIQENISNILISFLYPIKVMFCISENVDHTKYMQVHIRFKPCNFWVNNNRFDSKLTDSTGREIFYSRFRQVSFCIHLASQKLPLLQCIQTFNPMIQYFYLS